MSKWRRTTLEELAHFQRGFDISKAEQQPGHVPVVSSSGITSYHSVAKVKGPGVTIGRKGTLGSVFYVPQDYWPHSTSLWVTDFKGNNPKFVYYFLHTLGLEQYDVGASNPTLNRNHIHGLQIEIPDVPTQRHIADILSAYDDLIENNRRRIAILEETARLAFQTSIVAGPWKCEPISELVEVNPEVPTPKYDRIRYIPMSALSTTGMTVDLSDSEMREKSTSVRFVNGDVLLARITPCLENGKTAYVSFLEDDEIGCGSSEFIVLRGKRVSSYFTYCLSRLEAFRGIAIKSMVGASGRQRVQPSCFSDFWIQFPDEETLQDFDITVAPMFKQISILAKQNAALAAARDMLLPRLMKGELA